mmetsp:Transcript_89139/g.160786  ORF Transcript_89139/g.160786 Transcript_89139/m.160786 type:complete len:293 (-) Transcript_89139:2574-3452(-)
MLLQYVWPRTIVERNLLEVVCILGSNVVRLVLHDDHGPAIQFLKVEVYGVVASGREDPHFLPVKLPRLLPIHEHPAHPHGAIWLATHHTTNVLWLDLALAGEMVEFRIPSHKAVWKASHRAVHVVIDSRHRPSVACPLRGVEPPRFLEAHGASSLKASIEYRIFEVVDDSHPGDVKIFVVLRCPNAQTASRGRRIWSNIADQVEVVIERSCVKIVTQVVHEVPGATFQEPVVVVEDVARTVVEHSRAAAEDCEVFEGVESWRCVRRLQMPPKSTGMGRVIEKGQVRLFFFRH